MLKKRFLILLFVLALSFGCAKKAPTELYSCPDSWIKIEFTDEEGKICYCNLGHHFEYCQGFLYDHLPVD